MNPRVNQSAAREASGWVQTELGSEEKKREGDSNRIMEKKGENWQVNQDSQEHQKSQEQAKRGAKKVHDQHSRYI